MPSTTTERSSLRDLIPDDSSDEIDFTGTESPIALEDLFESGNGRWVGLYDRISRKHLDEELALCKLLSQDSATDEGAEVDVDEFTGEILIT